MAAYARDPEPQRRANAVGVCPAGISIGMKWEGNMLIKRNMLRKEYLNIAVTLRRIARNMAC